MPAIGVSVGVGHRRRRSGSPIALFDALVSSALPSWLTYSMSTPQWYFDSTGTLQQAALNTPPFAYDPSTLTPLGVQKEPTATNQSANNTYQGGVAGTPGTAPNGWSITSTGNGLTRTLAFSDINGMPGMSVRFAGTATAGGSVSLKGTATNAIAAVNGQTWAHSAYVALQGGSFSNLTSVLIGADLYNSSNTYLSSIGSSTSIATASATPSRFINLGTIANASAAFVQPTLYAVFNAGAVINFTIWVALDQMEGGTTAPGTFATSPILTYGSPVIRAEPIISVTGAPLAALTGPQATIAIEALAEGLPNANTRWFSVYPNATPAKYFEGGNYSNTAAFAYIPGSQSASSSNGGNITTAVRRMVSGWSMTSGAISLAYDGGSVVSATTASQPTGADKVIVGNNSSGIRPFAGYFSRIAIWNTNVPDAKKQAYSVAGAAWN